MSSEIEVRKPRGARRGDRFSPKIDIGNVDWDPGKVKETLLFLAIPASVIAIPLVFGIGLPKIVLYGVVGIVGLVLLVKSVKDPEYVIAITLFYIPLAKMIPAVILPGLNGTNVLLLLLLFSRIANSQRYIQYKLQTNPFNKLVIYFFVLSCFSLVTMVFTLGSFGYVFQVINEYKSWVDQFILFFLLSALIKTGALSRRVVLYMAAGFMAVMVLGVQEMIDVSGASSIEKSRLHGPQNQPNNFAAFLVYNITFLLAVLLVTWGSIKSWFLIPYLIIALKVLITTFSRGAYLGLAAAAAVMGYVRGLRYVVLGVLVITFTVFVMPELIPDSIMARMSQTQSEDTEKVDKSSQTRLILWKAAVDMSLESPIFGKGFKVFPLLKGEYTEEEVEESDNHNMYLFISSNMGIPTLVVFLLIIIKMFFVSRKIHKYHPDTFAKAIAVGGCGMSAAILVINMFGSRMVNIETCGYVWVYLVVLGVLLREVEQSRRNETPPRRSRARLSR